MSVCREAIDQSDLAKLSTVSVTVLSTKPGISIAGQGCRSHGHGKPTRPAKRVSRPVEAAPPGIVLTESPCPLLWHVSQRSLPPHEGGFQLRIGAFTVTAVLIASTNSTAPVIAASDRDFLTAEQLITALRPRRSQPMSTIAHWIVQKDVLSLHRQGCLVLPMFQFSQPELDPLPIMHLILGELSSVLAEAELADWFYTPNVWLDGCLPACAVRVRANAVYQAARADRWTMRG